MEEEVSMYDKLTKWFFAIWFTAACASVVILLTVAVGILMMVMGTVTGAR
jgi:hypothetical protein